MLPNLSAFIIRLRMECSITDSLQRYIPAHNDTTLTGIRCSTVVFFSFRFFRVSFLLPETGEICENKRFRFTWKVTVRTLVFFWGVRGRSPRIFREICGEMYGKY